MPAAGRPEPAQVLAQTGDDFFGLVCRVRARLIDPPAATRWLPKTVTFLTWGRWVGLLGALRMVTTRGPGLRVVVAAAAFSLGGTGRQSTSSLPMCCTGAASSWSHRAVNRCSRRSRWSL